MLSPILYRERRPSLWEDVSSLHSQLDRLFGLAGGTTASSEDLGSAWWPAVDVFEQQNELVVETELPGLTAADVEVNVENGVLTISGEKRREVREGRDESAHSYYERRYGRFQRSFTLPKTVDADKVRAEFADGVLTVALPKADAAKPRRIPVKAGRRDT